MGRFLPAGRSRPPADGRVLATVLFTDIVGSTELAARLGDRRWRALIAEHHAAVRRELRRFGGREVDTAGDGFFATFEQPAQAVRCAAAIVQRVGELGIRLRAGVHAGEVEVAAGGVGGIAVHIGARVAAEAQPGEVLVSSTVRQLLAGSDLQFADRGPRQLKGVPGEWHLFALEGLEIPDTEGAGIAAAPVATPRAGAARPVAATWVVVGAGAVVALLAAAAVLLAGRPAEQAPVAGPNTVSAFDPATGQIRQVIRVGSGPAALALAPDAIWVGNVGDRTVSRLDAAAGREVARAGGVGVPGSLAAADGTVFIADTFAGTLSTIDSRTNEVDRVVVIRGRDIVVAFGLLWLTDHVTGSVTLVNPRTLVAEGSIGLPAGSDPGAILASPEAIWVADRAQAALHRIDPVTKALAGTVALCCRPTDLAWALGSIWVTSADRDRVLRVDPTNGQVVRSIDVGDGPESIAGSDQGIWVAHPASGDIWKLDAQGGRAAIIAVSGQPRALAAGLDSVWVAIGAP